MTDIGSAMTKHKTQNTLLMATALTLSLFTLGGCQTTQTEARMDRSDQIAAAIRRAENASGIQRSLKTLEGRYKRNSDSEIAATQYAHALRKKDFLPEADAVLAPFAKEKTSSAATKTEYAVILLEQGKLKSAEKIAQKAILSNDEYDRAYHILGIALDAQGLHKEGERAFRKGLELWQGDPTTIMNNLALNLTAQNHLEEAVEILEKAKAISPKRREIERNLRIVRALQQSHAKPVPKPKTKPEIPAKKSEEG